LEGGWICAVVVATAFYDYMRIETRVMQRIAEDGLKDCARMKPKYSPFRKYRKAASHLKKAG